MLSAWDDVREDDETPMRFERMFGLVLIHHSSLPVVMSDMQSERSDSSGGLTGESMEITLFGTRGCLELTYS